MQKFTTLTSIPAPLPLVNIDTDMIIPKQFLKTIKRTGLGEGLFYEMRYDVNGKKNDGFVLHNAPYDTAQILLAGENFGCGSSREHAPWALLDFGIRCVIAPSFADIFFNNCFKNGILPIVLPKETVEKLIAEAQSAPAPLSVDLTAQAVESRALGRISFDVEAFRKHCLLNGLDDIGMTLEHGQAIAGFEATQQKSQPWLYS
ncbi:MAG: 3-isopropylmalate dehydratase small subunit [Alphaproteobacteria bacterium]|nr:3-isopropylmalate dehydratase small subunit [Alphaproteobacteria bacterium]